MRTYNVYNIFANDRFATARPNDYCRARDNSFIGAIRARVAILITFKWA